MSIQCKNNGFWPATLRNALGLVIAWRFIPKHIEKIAELVFDLAHTLGWVIIRLSCIALLLVCPLLFLLAPLGTLFDRLSEKLEREQIKEIERRYFSQTQKARTTARDDSD